MTTRSSAMSPSGFVSNRWVNPLPGPEVFVRTMLAPIKRSIALLVIIAPLLLAALFPVAPAPTSRGLTGSIPLYSKILMSAKAAAALKLKVTVLAPARAAEMFFA